MQDQHIFLIKHLSTVVYSSVGGGPRCNIVIYLFPKQIKMIETTETEEGNCDMLTETIGSSVSKKSELLEIRKIIHLLSNQTVQ